MDHYTEKDEALNQCIETVNELTDKVKQYSDEIEAIFNIIDLRIQENRELAILHFPQEEDKYINEYESRADELEQLKRMIQK